MRLTSLGLAVASTATLTMAAPVDHARAQLPGGLDPQTVREMIPSSVNVRAGETTTVDVGVPVTANYNADGWSVSANGTSVSVTAPDSPGATANVPASAFGYDATITLVAVGPSDSTTLEELNEAPPAAPAASDAPAAPAQPVQPASPAKEAEATSDGATRTHPARTKAEPADTAAAKKFYFDGEIEGNSLVVTVPLSRAADLAKYANTDREGAKLRYLDVDGNIIQGVTRKVEVAARKLTLKYPEGETPDNPFIMEVVRDGKAEFIAVITAQNVETEAPADIESNPYADVATESQAPSNDSGRSIAPLAIGGVALLTLIALAIAWLRRRGTARA